MASFHIDSDSFHSSLETLFEQALEQGFFQATSAEYVIGGPSGSKMTVRIKGARATRTSRPDTKEGP